MAKMFSQANAAQGEDLREAVSDFTLQALQGRGLTLANIRAVLKAAAQATSLGAAENPSHEMDIEALLGAAFAGMDAALQLAVQARRKVLEKFVDQGVGLQESPIRDIPERIDRISVPTPTTSTKVRDRQRLYCIVTNGETRMESSS